MKVYRRYKGQNGMARCVGMPPMDLEWPGEKKLWYMVLIQGLVDLKFEGKKFDRQSLQIIADSINIDIEWILRKFAEQGDRDEERDIERSASI